VAACAHCHRRKGKRECPALAGRICATCCGRYRRVEIRCPDDCPYLGSHEAYQQQRLLGRAPRAWVERMLRYERRGGAALGILHVAETTICRYAGERRPLDLAGAREGLEFARRRMSLIETPEPYRPPFGEFAVQALDEAIGSEVAIDRGAVREVLDEMLRFLENEVPAERWGEYLEFLLALYGPDLAGSGRRAGDSGLIVPA
jgi:hypothetical protein